jgi:hypothetical protein
MERGSRMSDGMSWAMEYSLSGKLLAEQGRDDIGVGVQLDAIPQLNWIQSVEGQSYWV